MRRLSPLLLLSPFLAFAAAFLVLPMLLVAGASLCHTAADGSLVWDGSLACYRAIAHPRYAVVLARSACYAGTATLGTLLLAAPLAWFIAMHGGPHKHRWLLLVMLPFWTSYLVRIYAWKAVLANHGLLNTLLLELGVIQAPLQLLNTQAAVVVGLVYGFLPFMTMPVYVSLDKLDRSLLEAARDLGADPWGVMLHVVLPLCLPGIAGGCLLTFVPAIGDFVTPDLLGGPAHTMIGNVIESKFFPELDWPVGSALACALMALLMLGVVLQARLQGKEL